MLFFITLVRHCYQSAIYPSIFNVKLPRWCNKWSNRMRFRQRSEIYSESFVRKKVTKLEESGSSLTSIALRFFKTPKLIQRLDRSRQANKTRVGSRYVVAKLSETINWAKAATSTTCHYSRQFHERAGTKIVDRFQRRQARILRSSVYRSIHMYKWTNRYVENLFIVISIFFPLSASVILHFLCEKGKAEAPDAIKGKQN